VFKTANINLFGYTANNPIKFIDPNGMFKSPTQSLEIRNDSMGSGEYMASRRGGKDKHAGVDLAAPAGSSIVAPISGTVEFVQEGKEQFIRITGKDNDEKLTVRLVHIEFDDKLKGAIRKVEEGETIEGVKVQDLSKHPRFKGSDPHVHLEVYKEGKTRTNPMTYLNNEHIKKQSNTTAQQD